MIIPEKNLKKMIGDDPYYLNINRTGKYGFNWGAAVLPIWMLYRNLYTLSFLLPILLWQVMNIVIPKIAPSFLMYGGFSLLPWLLATTALWFRGVMGNRLYFYFLKEMDKTGLVPLTGDTRAVNIVLILGTISIVIGFLLVIMLGGQEAKIRLSEWGIFLIPLSMGIFWIFGKEKRPEVFFFPFPQLFQKLRKRFSL